MIGEKNLVLSGGCVLNCNMNFMLSEFKFFDNFYVFLAVNDVGCSIGVVLVLFNIIKLLKILVKRFIFFGFGCIYIN